MKNMHIKRVATAMVLTAVGASVLGQTLPPPPVSPPPVVTYEYDAQGNRTKVTQGAGTLNLQTTATYDPLQRLKDSTDPRNGKTSLEYDGGDRTTKVTDPRQLQTRYPRNGFGDATQLVSPDTGTATLTYDSARNLKTRTDSRGVLETYTYDELNRLTKAVYSRSGQPSETVTWGWDMSGPDYAYGMDRLGRTDHPAGASRFKYDPQGRVVEAVQAVYAAAGANAATVVTSVKYGYTLGRLTSITYPSGRQLRLSYTGRLVTGLSLAQDANGTAVPMLSQIEWEPFGPVNGWNWNMASGLVAHQRFFDLSGRVVRYRLGGVFRDVTYDAANRIVSFTHLLASNGTAQPALDQSFGYDENSRLTRITTAAASWTMAYDPNGNRTSVSLNGSPSAYTTEATSNRLTGITNPARSFGYDNAGNTTIDSAGYTATYGVRGQLTTLSRAGVIATYNYDAERRRVRKFTTAGPASTVIFVYDLDGQLLGEYDQTGQALREYVWLDGTPVAMFTPDPANASNPPITYFIHADHLNTPRIVVDRNGAKRWRWLAEPFGTTAPEVNPDGLGVFTQNLRMPGQYADVESGLWYNYFRSYDNSRGGYAQADLIGLSGGINAYSYASGNPLSVIDPNGLAGCRWVGLALVCEWGPTPAIDPDNPNTTSPVWPSFRNPFDGMFATPRPKDMTRLEERQFDRVCAGAGDPCQALKAEANKVIDAALPKVEDMLADEGGMFGTQGWRNHAINLMGRIDQLSAIISLGQKMGCDMSSEIVRASQLWIPSVPRKLISPK